MKLSQVAHNIIPSDARSKLVGKNIVGTLLVKSWGIVVQLLLVPITLQCLSAYEYGIWLTLNSILVWIDTMDIGLGNGLRNRLAQALAKDDKEHGQTLVSTAFVMLILIVTPMIVLLCLGIDAINIHRLLNVDVARVPNLAGILMLSLSCVGVSFIFKFISNIYLALQLPMVSNAIVVGGQTLALVLIAILRNVLHLSLLDVALIYTLSPLFIYLLSYPITFSRYPYLKPRLKLFRRSDIRPLFGLGIKFFVAQIAGMVIFTSSNIIISHLFSPEEVTTYQIVYKYFCITNMLFTIISMPLWSATTDAYARGDVAWIEHTMRRMRWIMMLFAIGLCMMILLAMPIYGIWVGKEIVIPSLLNIAMAIYMFVLIYGTNYSNILCGMGKINLLMYVTCAEAILFIPASIVLGKIYGVAGVIYASILINTLSAITNKIQYKLLVTGKARGLWNK